MEAAPSGILSRNPAVWVVVEGSVASVRVMPMPILAPRFVSSRLDVHRGFGNYVPALVLISVIVIVRHGLSLNVGCKEAFAPA